MLSIGWAEIAPDPAVVALAAADDVRVVGSTSVVPATVTVVRVAGVAELRDWAMIGERAPSPPRTRRSAWLIMLLEI